MARTEHVREWVLKYPGDEPGQIIREVHTDREHMDSIVAGLVAKGKCCVITPKRDESRVAVEHYHSGVLTMGPARGALFIEIKGKSSEQ